MEDIASGISRNRTVKRVLLNRKLEIGLMMNYADIMRASVKPPMSPSQFSTSYDYLFMVFFFSFILISKLLNL